MDKEEAKINSEKIKTLAQKGKEDFFFFVRYILGSAVGFELIEEVPHKEMCAMAQKWNRRKKIILTPRDTFKTTIFVVAYSLWRLVNNPLMSILITGDKQASSMSSLAAIKDVIEFHEVFKLCYGDIVHRDPDLAWTSNKIFLSARKGNSKRAPSIMTSGVDSSKVGFHFDLIEFDDPHNEKNISTPEQLLKVINYYKLLNPVMDTLTGEFQITATRWHHQDVNNYVMTEEKYKWDIFIRSAEWEENGEIKYFYPKRLTPEFLKGRKEDLQTYHYSCQYLNSPTDDENALFKQSLFKYFSKGDDCIYVSDGLEQTKIKMNDLKFFISVDPAGRGTLSEQRRLDYTGFLVVGVDYLKRWFIFEAMRKKGMQPSDIVEQLINYHFQYKPETIGIEATTYYGQIRQDLESECSKRGILQYVKDLEHHNQEKSQRIRGLQPLYKRGSIYHAKGLFDLELELLTWSPNSVVHDDLIDAEAYISDIAYSPEETEVETIVSKDFYRSPEYFIAADMEWTRQGCRGSFNEFLETYTHKDYEEKKVEDSREYESLLLGNLGLGVVNV